MKVVVRLVLILLAVITVFFTSNAQQQGLTEADLLLTPVELLEENLSGEGNSSFVQQLGSENKVDVIQQQQGDARINLVKVLQSGDYNEVYILQNGSGNQTAVIQNGNDNFYDLKLNGADNNMAIIQDGDNNRVIQDLNNTNSLNIEFVQQGNNNEVIQNLDGTNAQEFKVIQIGDGLRAIINQEGSN